MVEEKGINYLRKKLSKYQPRIETRYSQYDMAHRDIDPGITIPPRLRYQYKATLGWCTKAVDSLADRLIFREFENDNFSINQIFQMNNPDTFFDSAILSALISSCCFVYISMGETGTPRLQIIEGNRRRESTISAVPCRESLSLALHHRLASVLSLYIH